MKTWMLMIFAAACLINGCSQTSARGTGGQSWRTLEDCRAANTDLQMRVDALLAENDSLAEQVQTLSSLDERIRLDELATLQSIHIGKRSGFFDKDDDGNKETLIVYITPKDMAQDAIKAVGKCTLELWDLNGQPQEALLKSWTIAPSDLRGIWGGNIFGAYYRLVFDIRGLVPDNTAELTIKAEFTDYLSGKVVRDQKVIEP